MGEWIKFNRRSQWANYLEKVGFEKYQEDWEKAKKEELKLLKRLSAHPYVTLSINKEDKNGIFVNRLFLNIKDITVKNVKIDNDNVMFYTRSDIPARLFMNVGNLPAWETFEALSKDKEFKDFYFEFNENFTLSFI